MGFATGRLGTFETVAEAQAQASKGVRYAWLPRGTRRVAVDAGGVPAVWIVPPVDDGAVTILYLHGGAWTLGWSMLHFSLVGYLAQRSRARALMLDYRLAPQHPFPAALDDCLAAYRWLLAGGSAPSRIVIAGDSAGGNLTLTTLLALKGRGEPLPAGGVCISPVTDLQPDTLAHRHAAGKDAGLPHHSVALQPLHYVGDNDPRDPLVSPVYGDLRGLPPLLIQAGGDEHLRDDAERFAARAREAGVDARLEVYPGMWHVFQILTPWLPEANRAVASMASFVQGRGATGAADG
jgi:acetyl esterase/lipase